MKRVVHANDRTLPYMCWNPPIHQSELAPKIKNIPRNVLDLSVEENHPLVRNTCYMEVHHGLGTNGCSPESPWWNWTCIGVIDTPRGKIFVFPGDYIVGEDRSTVRVLSHENFVRDYGEVV